MTITLTREEAQQVLEAFDVATTHFAKDRNEILAAVELLRARLSAPEPEPVAGCACRWDSEDKRIITCERHQGWLDVIGEWADRAREAEQKLRSKNMDRQCPSCGGFCKKSGCERENIAPPQREWQGLTDEDIAEMHYEIKVKGMGAYKTEDIYRAIEAKLKEKNT